MLSANRMKPQVSLERAPAQAPGRWHARAERRPALLRHQPFTARPQERRQHALCRSAGNGSSPPTDGNGASSGAGASSEELAAILGGPEIISQAVKLVGTYDSSDGEEEMSELDMRIMRGEYSDEGSTKDRLTRPLRKVLAKNPVPPGASPPYQRWGAQPVPPCALACQPSDWEG